MSDRRRRPPLMQVVDWLHKMALPETVNVALEVDQSELDKIGLRVVREYEIDERSRETWRKHAEEALKLANQEADEKNYPFENASNVKYPLLTTASLQFAARAYPAIVDGPLIVKVQVKGVDPDGQKAAKAGRISAHMSHQLLDEMEEWEGDTDTMLHQLPIVGHAFRKVYYDRLKGRNVSEMVSALHVVINQHAKSIETVPRITHCFEMYPHEIEEKRRSGEFLDIEFPSAASGDGDEDAPHEFLEQHRWLDLDEDGFSEPWCVTVHKETEKVVRVQPNYDPQTIVVDEKKGRIVRIPRYSYFVSYQFLPDPAGGFYGNGFGKLLGPLSTTIDSTINQMMDAGHLQNAGGGFIGSGLKLKTSTIRFAPGKYHTVDAPGQSIRDSIVHMEHPGPSPVLFQLLSLMIDASKDIAAIQDILVGDMPRGQTATTTLAMIEQGLKVFTAIYKRIFRSLTREYQLLFELNARYMRDEQRITLHDQPITVIGKDYDVASYDVRPVADPKLVTDMQRITRAQAVLELAKGNPLINPLVATKRFLEAIGETSTDELLVQPQGPSPEEQMAVEKEIAGIAKTKAETARTAAEADRVNMENEGLGRANDADRFGQDVEGELASLLADEQEAANDAAPPDGMPQVA